MASTEINTPEKQQEKKVISLSRETKNNPEWQNIKKETQTKLEELKEEIKSKWMSFELVKKILENLNEIKNENRPFLLWSIFSGLNKRWISMAWIDKDWKIILKEWKQNTTKGLEIADYKEVTKYSELLNNYLSTWKITVSDINKSLMYRTTSIDDYIEENPSWELKTSKYVERLLKRYKLDENIKIWEKWFYNENDYLLAKKIVNNKVTNSQADKEFLLAYFDDMFYRWNKNIDENAINDYKKDWQELEKWILKSLNELTEEQRFALWVRDENKAKDISKEIKKDPLWFIWKNINKDNFILAFLVWIVWAIFWWKKWFLIWWVLWFLWWSVWFANAWEMLKELWKRREAENENNDKKKSKKPKNSIYEKYVWVLTSQEDKQLDETKMLLIWDELSKNDNFLSAPSTILKIFETQKDEVKLKTTLKAYWIELTNENKDYYKTIFFEILKQREAAWIWKPLQAENIQTYLTKSSITTEAAVTTWAVTKAASENIWERFQVSWYSQNGRNYIIGPDGNPKLIEYSQLSPEFQRQIERLELSWKIVSNFMLILQALMKKNSDKYSPILKELQDKINTVDISKTKDVENLLRWIYESRDIINTSLNNGNDAQTHPWTLNINLSKDEEVLKLIRKIDSENAKQHLIEKLFSLTGISDEELNNFITNTGWNHQKIQNLLWNDAYMRFSIEISKKKSQAEVYFIENKENFKKQIKERNNGISDTEVNKILDEQYKSMITRSFVHSFAKNKLLETFLEKNTQKNWLWEYNGNNELLKLYWDIVWVGWGNFSDTSKNWWKETLLLIWTQIIAIWAWAVTLWAWFYAVNAAVWWTRTYKWIKALQLWSEAWKLAKLWKWWTMSIIEWSSFYLWYGWAQSIIEWKNMYSKEWLMHSIAFAWAFKALKAIPWLKLNPDVALSQQKLKITSVLAADTATLWAIWLGFDGVLFEPGEWTIEHFIQAFAMAIMFRWMTHAGEKINLKFRKNWEKIEVENINFSRNWDGYQANILSRTPKSAQESAQVFEQFFWKKDSLIKSLLPKKTGDKVTIWWKKIEKTQNWFKIWNTSYDKIDDMLPVLSRELSDTQIIVKINEWWAKNINKLLNWAANKEIQIWDDIFRFKTESWKNILEIKNWSWWTVKSIDELSESQAQILLDRILRDGVIGWVKSFQFTWDRLQSVKNWIWKMNEFIMKSKMDTSKWNPFLLKTIINDWVTHPLRVVSQIIDTLANWTTKKTDLLKLLTLWNKWDIKDIIKSDWARLAFTAWAAGNFVIWNEKWSVEDILEFFLYNQLWLILWWIVDTNIED